MCVIALAVAFFLFVLIAADVMNGGMLASLDTRTNLWLYTHRTAGRTTFFRWVSTLHSNWIAGIVTLGICVYLWRRRLPHWVLMFVLTIFGGMLLNALLKLWFVRPRPDVGGVIYVSRSYSFPSGHTLLATVFYGTLCVFVVSRLRDWKSRALAILFSVFMIPLVGFSRMYLGAHYLTDVLAGIMEGISWIAACLLSLEIVRRRRQA
ncbi:MAG TPA: phosphatase PAP2 family protein [Pyrinomonadaceae bacterium]